MIGWIVEICAELALLREDFKHHKKITKKEKEDGVKRPFQRYLLQPSSLMVITFLTIGSISAFIFLTYQIKLVYPQKTKKELSEMSEWIEKCNEKFGEYPKDLNEVIGNNPMRQHWDNDAWSRPYKYATLKDGKEFLLISAGPDGQFETEDDIKAE